MDSKKFRQNDMESCVLAVEEILSYKFRNRKLLEDALTHPSFTNSTSYQRLEFVGDAALGLAFANFVYLTYPSLEPGRLSLLRAANVSTEKLARVAVRHGFYRFVRHNAVVLEERVREFVLAVMEEDRAEVYGGAVKAPKVLADIVESIAAAVYIDCEFDLKALWMVFRCLLEPIITSETLQEQPQPITMLVDLCQKQGKDVHIEPVRKDSRTIATVYVDGKFVASSSSPQKEIARLNAARAALRTLAQSNMLDSGDTNTTFEVNEKNEIFAAKQKLHEICKTKKWSKPSYRLEKEEGPSHDKRYICSVQIEVEEAVLFMQGDERSKVKDAQNSAASFMICSLLESGHV